MIRKIFRMSEQQIEADIPEQVEEAEDSLIDSTEGTQDYIDELMEEK